MDDLMDDGIVDVNVGHQCLSMVIVMKMKSGVKSAIIFTKKYEIYSFYLLLKLNQYLYTLSWIQLL